MENLLHAKLDAYIQQNTPKMEEQTTWQVIGAAVVGVVSALGLPKLWEAAFGYWGKTHTAKITNDAEIQNLKERITKIVISVDMLLIIIKHEFEENASITTAIEKVEEILHQEAEVAKPETKT